MRSIIPAHKMPAALALGAAIMLGGMAAGQSIGATPILDREAQATMPSGDYDPSLADPYAGSRDRPPADQYAIETPDGRFEISELSQRGLYSQRRFGGGASFFAAQIDDWEAQDAAIAQELAEWERRDSSAAVSASDHTNVRIIRAEQRDPHDMIEIDIAPTDAVSEMPVLALGN